MDCHPQLPVFSWISLNEMYIFWVWWWRRLLKWQFSWPISCTRQDEFASIEYWLHRIASQSNCTGLDGVARVRSVIWMSMYMTRGGPCYISFSWLKKIFRDYGHCFGQGWSKCRWCSSGFIIGLMLILMTRPVVDLMLVVECWFCFPACCSGDGIFEGTSWMNFKCTAIMSVEIPDKIFIQDFLVPIASITQSPIISAREISIQWC